MFQIHSLLEMSDLEDNISDFDEDEDDPDHMVIPGAPIAAKPLAGTFTLND